VKLPNAQVVFVTLDTSRFLYHSKGDAKLKSVGMKTAIFAFDYGKK
jgi:hypothetical protein